MTHRQEITRVLSKESVGGSERVRSVRVVNFREKRLETLVDIFTFVQTECLVIEDKDTDV